MQFKSLQGGKYEIQAILGQGGYGITYLATQTMLNRQVAIKEFFMKDYCERAGEGAEVTMGTHGSREMVLRYREKFKKEAATLARLNHPNIVRVIDMFEENNTYYYVMEYADGPSLRQIIKARVKLPTDEALAMIKQVADAVSYLHQENLCHYDIKPANILTNHMGKAILADFGMAKQYDEQGEETSSTPVGKSKGYAPPEQYLAGSVNAFSPETDIYALAATLYKLLTGITPIESIIRNEKEIDFFILPTNLIMSIQKAMSLKRKERFHSVEEFIETITSQEHEIKEDEEITLIDITEPDQPEKQNAKSFIEWLKNKFNKKEQILLSLTVVLVVGGIWWWNWKRNDHPLEPITADSTAISNEELKNKFDSIEINTAAPDYSNELADSVLVEDEDLKEKEKLTRLQEKLDKAKILVNTNKLSEAHNSLKILVINEDYKPAYYAYAICLFKEKMFEEAKLWAKRSIEAKMEITKSRELIQAIERFQSLGE